MKKFLETIKNIWKIEELRNRILVTLGILAIYRLGSFVVIPGVDPSQLS
ncbi:MAG: preprotein translocase subunit SecY, partial [Flavobacteriales bacterium]|nr:preprotein translocase subunit SecY [Flavobacteriales bacterium]